jgi:hypothetical protein
MSDDAAATPIIDDIVLPAPTIGGNVIRLSDVERSRRSSGPRTFFGRQDITPEQVLAWFVRVQRPHCPAPLAVTPAVQALANFLSVMKDTPPRVDWPMALPDDVQARLKQDVEDLNGLEVILAERVLAGGAPEVIHNALSWVHTIRDTVPQLLAVVHSPPESAWDASARFIDSYARRVWKEIEGARPGGTGSSQPRVRLVELALKELGGGRVRGRDAIRKALEEGWQPKAKKAKRPATRRRRRRKATKPAA